MLGRAHYLLTRSVAWDDVCAVYQTFSLSLFIQIHICEFFTKHRCFLLSKTRLICHSGSTSSFTVVLMRGPPNSNLPWALKAGRYEESDENPAQSYGTWWYFVWPIYIMMIACHDKKHESTLSSAFFLHDAFMMHRTDNTMLPLFSREIKRCFKQARKIYLKGCAGLCSCNRLTHWLFCCRMPLKHIYMLYGCPYKLHIICMQTAQSSRLLVMIYYWSGVLSASLQELGRP